MNITSYFGGENNQTSRRPTFAECLCSVNKPAMFEQKFVLSDFVDGLNAETTNLQSLHNIDISVAV